MSNRKLWTTSVDTYSAESVEHATELRDKDYGYEPGSDNALADPFDPEPMPGNKLYSVVYHEGYDGHEYPPWVDSEPACTLERIQLRSTKTEAPRVTAPAHVWAKHEVGMVGTTEW